MPYKKRQNTTQWCERCDRVCWMALNLMSEKMSPNGAFSFHGDSSIRTRTRVFQLKFSTPNVWAKSLCLPINKQFSLSHVIWANCRDVDGNGGGSFNEPAKPKVAFVQIRKHRNIGIHTVFNWWNCLTKWIRMRLSAFIKWNSQCGFKGRFELEDIDTQTHSLSYTGKKLCSQWT